MTTSSSTTTKITAVASASSASTTPSWQIPKDEIDVLPLLSNSSSADGRHIRMAILDTGCDLAARGLEVTTTGQPKYLDFIDCTGDGDIDMSTRKPVTVANNTVTVTGITGKTLTLPPSILDDAINKTDHDEQGDPKVRLGAMPLYHILPKTALARVKEERKSKFLQIHNNRIAQAQKALDQLRLQQNQLKTEAAQENNKTGTETKNNATTDATSKSLNKEIKETELLIEELQDIVKEYSDAGPIMDVVLFQKTIHPTNNDNIAEKDGTPRKVWQALIDLNADGNLTSFTPMAPYGVNREFGTLQFGSQVTFCIQVYEDGDILSIVCDAGSHGTHVAGIAAANFANNPADNPTSSSKEENNNDKQQKDGVAPGAQVLACKIGDVRVSSAETGTGLIRALIAAKKYNCHLVNLSYGEPSWQPDSGRVAQVFHDAVHKWGLTVFTSAGNDGPALSTIGSPGTLSSLITVGAYVSPQMMIDQYSALLSDNTMTNSKADADNTSDGPPGASYSFSSRGPTLDGRLPDICAPGGAIASLPRHTLQGKGQKHGTSMACPSATGTAAVLLSALKEKGIDVENDFNPHELRRALVNSANRGPDNNGQSEKIVFDPFAQGAGLVSAARALEYALAHHGKPGQNLSFDVKIPKSNNARGIYIRDALQLAGPMTQTVHVKPHFEHHSSQKTDEEMDELLSLELELDLVPSQKWVQCPQRMTLVSSKERSIGQSFSVRVDPKSLSPGAHFATVDAIDSNDPDRGPLFQVPITVIVPHAIVRTPPFEYAAGLESCSSDSDKTMDITTEDNDIDITMRYELAPGAPERRFLSVPASAEWATIKLRSTSPTADYSAPHSVILHAVPFARGDLPNTMVQIKKFFVLNEGTERVYHVQVKGLSTLEVCLQLSWLANPSPASVVANVEFHSLDVRPPNFVSSQPVRISAATEFARFGVGAPFRNEKINPKATLTGIYRTIGPKEYKISAASYDDRDILPYSDSEIRAAASSVTDKKEEEGRESHGGTLVYKALLEYAFKLADSKDDTSISVIPRIPSLFHQIYDSPIDSQLWMLQDKNGKILGYGGCMHEAAAISLNSKPGGEYKLTLRISHPNRSVLEQLKDLPLRLQMKLTKELDCPVYSKLDKASTPGVPDDGREQVKEVRLPRGAHQDLYVTRPTAKLPDWIQPGDIMLGSVKLDQKNTGATSLDLFYEVPPKSVVVDGMKKDDPKKDEEDKSEDKDVEEELAESIFKAKVGHLSKLRTKKKSEAYELLAAELKAEKGDDLSLLEELLTYAKEAKAPDDQAENEKRWRAAKVAEAVDAMKNSNGGPIDEASIAQYYGCNNPLPEEDEDDDKKKEAEKTKKEMDERRKAWRSALLAKAGAWSDSEDSSAQLNEGDQALFDDSVQELKKWVSAAGDLSSDKEKVRHAVILSRHSRICQNKTVGALASLRKARKDLPSEFYKELTEEMVKVAESIDGMEYWLKLISEDLAERYPKVKPML